MSNRTGLVSSRNSDTDAFRASVIAAAATFRDGFTVNAMAAVLARHAELTGSDELDLPGDDVSSGGERLGARLEELRADGHFARRDTGSFVRYELASHTHEPASHILQAAHASFFSGEARRWIEQLRTPMAPDTLDCIEADSANLVAAEDWWLANGNPMAALGIVRLLGESARVRGAAAERTRQRLERHLPSLASAPSKVRVEAHLVMATLLEGCGEFDEALRNASAAEQLAKGRMPQHALALRAQARILETSGEPAQAIDKFGLSEQLHRRAGDMSGVADSMRGRAQTYMRLGDLESANITLGRAEQLARKHSSPVCLAGVLQTRGEVAWRRGEPARAAGYFLEAEELGSDPGDPLLILHSLRYRGMVERQLGHSVQAIRTFRRAEFLARRLRNERELSGVLNSLSTVLWDSKSHRDAIMCLGEAEQLHRRLGYRQGVASCLNNRGRMLTEVGRLDEAEPCLVEAERIYRELRHLRGRAINAINRADLSDRRGDHELALRTYIQAETMAAEAGEHMWIATSRSARARMHLRRDEHEQAYEALASALEFFRQSGLENGPGGRTCRAQLALAAERNGELELARELASELLIDLAEDPSPTMQADLSDALPALERLAKAD